MWQEGKFEIDGNRFFYRVKLVEGAIKKLLIHENYQPKRLIVTPVALFDDGWEVKPRSSLGKEALEYVFGLFEVKEVL